MVALSARRLVCSAMSVIRRTTSPMRLAASLSSCTATLVRSASPTAFSAMAFDCATWRSISITDAASSSVAEAMSRTLAEASAEAEVAPSVRRAARSAASDRCVADSSIWSLMAPSSAMLRSNEVGERRDLGRQIAPGAARAPRSPSAIEWLSSLL